MNDAQHMEGDRVIHIPTRLTCEIVYIGIENRYTLEERNVYKVRTPRGRIIANVHDDDILSIQGNLFFQGNLF